MRSTKGTRRIVVGGVAYRWRARGEDTFISLSIWPANNIGPYVTSSIGYHTSPASIRAGVWTSGQIVVTNRLVRRVVEHAIAAHHYNPMAPGEDLHLPDLEAVIPWDDAVRAVPPSKENS